MRRRLFVRSPMYDTHSVTMNLGFHTFLLILCRFQLPAFSRTAHLIWWRWILRYFAEELGCIEDSLGFFNSSKGSRPTCDVYRRWCGNQQRNLRHVWARHFLRDSWRLFLISKWTILVIKRSLGFLSIWKFFFVSSRLRFFRITRTRKRGFSSAILSGILSWICNAD